MMEGQLLDLINFQVDESMEDAQDGVNSKIGEFNAGDGIGNFSHHHAINPFNDFTAVCLSDCILLRVNKDFFSILDNHCSEKKRQALKNFLFEKFPKFKDHY